MSESERIEKALDIAMQYGDFDGAHHKTWVIDQMVRALTGCPMVKKSVATDHGEYVFQDQGESQEYLAFVAKAREGEDGPETYGYDTGIAP